MSAFEEMGMMPELIQALEDMEWFLPRPVQQEAVPLILGGGDVMCAAETGSGKTGAFCLPIIQTVWEVLNSKINPEKKKSALSHCRLNRDDSDADFRTSEDGFQCQARNAQYWAGGRANYGVELGGKFYYEATLMDDGLARVGWSTLEASHELGVDRLGFGYGSTGKKSFGKQFDDYGCTYGKGATVGCLVDREAHIIAFAVNGKDCGVAFDPIPSVLKEEALYPAVCIKNAHVMLNFGQKPWKYPPPPGFKGMQSLREDLPRQERLYEKFHRIKEAREGEGHHPTAIIIEPTLELAQQVGDEIDKFVKYLENPKLRYTLLVGKRDFGSIMRDFEAGVDIVIGTPGRLMAMLEGKQLNVSRVRFFVLDEADRLSQDNLDIILKTYNAIMKDQRERLQVCMFSATLHSDEITNLSKQICPKATWVDLKGRDYVPETVHHGVVYVNPNDPALKQAALADYVDDQIHRSDNMSQNPDLKESLAVKRLKPEVVAKLIDAYQMSQCLIFCRTRLDCDNMKDFLDKRGGGRKFTGKVEKGKENPYSNVCLHSGYKPFERQENLQMFKDGEVRLLICTDVAARGIDIKSLPYVINVTLPDKDEDYIHRVGRVGRADCMGLAVSIVATAKEKVWYHQCPTRGEGCFNTNLVTQGGCAIWYDEPDLVKKVEGRIGETLLQMGKDFRHPVHQHLAPGETVVYGKTKADATKGMSEHIKAILSDVESLLVVEKEAQDAYLSVNTIIQGIMAIHKSGAAKNQVALNPENTVFDAKRLIGRSSLILPCRRI